MLIFVRKKLIKCFTVDEKNKIVSKLKKSNINYKALIKGISVFKRTGQIVWFNIYVHKNDYLKAKLIINN